MLGSEYIVNEAKKDWKNRYNRLDYQLLAIMFIFMIFLITLKIIF